MLPRNLAAVFLAAVPMQAVPQTPQHTSPAMPKAPERPSRKQLTDVEHVGGEDEEGLFLPPALVRCQLVFPDTDDEDEGDF